MNSSPGTAPFVRRDLRDAEEGQILLVAEVRFTILATHRQRTLVHLDLAAEDGEPATLIGRPRTRIVLLARTARGGGSRLGTAFTNPGHQDSALTPDAGAG